MKRIVTLAAILTLVGTVNAHGQLLKKFKDKVKEKAEQKADQKVDEAAQKTVDAPEEAMKKKKKSDDAKADSLNTSTNVATAAKSTVETTTKKSDVDYGSFDFVPGDSILFEDEFVNESVNEIPSLWIPYNGKVEIVKVDGKNAMGFLDGEPNVFPRMKKYGYLPKRFTVEYDFLSKHNAGKSNDQAAGDGNGYGGTKIYFYSTGKDDNGGDAVLGDFGNGNFLQLEHNGLVTFGKYTGNYTKGEKNNIPLDLNDKWVHVSISVTETNMKVYINSQRVLNVPIQEGRAQSISITGVGSDYEMSFKTFVRNVRIAGGLKTPYKQGTSEIPKAFIARGIKFDYQLATLKPESMGELNNVVAILKDHPEAKYEIGGHTSKAGNAATAANQKLSEERSKAVKDKLVSMGIDTSRLTTKGYGETKPIADNTTPEGRANNQRVEFTLLK